MSIVKSITSPIVRPITKNLLGEYVEQQYFVNWDGGASGWTTANGTIVAPAVIGGVSCLSFWPTADNASHFVKDNPNLAGITLGDEYELEFWYYIPSSNTNVDGINIIARGNSDGDINTPTLDQWNFYKNRYVADATNSIVIFQQSGGNTTFAGANSASDDLFYLRGLKLTKITS